MHNKSFQYLLVIKVVFLQLFAIRTQKLMDSLQAADDSVHNNGTKIIRQVIYLFDVLLRD